VPTYGRSDRFNRDYDALSEEDRNRFKVAVSKFVEDLNAGRAPRRSLGIRQFRSKPGVYEFHFEGDGRATFEFGASIRAGEVHVIWRRIGTHTIYLNP
jgi:hypothetical protein